MVHNSYILKINLADSILFVWLLRRVNNHINIIVYYEVGYFKIGFVRVIVM